MPTYTDTFGKIVSYFAMVTKEPFEFKGKTYTPKPLRISPDIARGYTCEMLEITDESRADTIRKLKRLERWAREFGLNTKVKDIIKWLETKPKEAIVL